jgi:hypothetical protein
MNPIIFLCVKVSFDWRTNDVTMIYDKAILRSSCHTSVSVYWAPPNQEESVPAALVLFFFLFPPRRVKSATHREHTQATRTESAKTKEHYIYSNHSPCFSVAIPLHTCTVAMAVVVVVEAPGLVMSIRASFTKLLV